MPDRDRIEDIKAAQMLIEGPITIVEVIRTLAEAGFDDVAANLLEMQRQRVIGDYLQTSGIFGSDGSRNFRVLSALTDANDYRGPGTGYRVEGRRWEQLQNIPQAWNPREFVEELECQVCAPWLEDVGPAAAGTLPEVVIAIGPAFGTGIQQALSGLDLQDVLTAMVQGIADEGLDARIVRIHHTSDCAFIGHAGAQLSGSGVAIGIQSRGTTVIHQRDLEPLENLELFSMSPNLDLDTYRRIGRNAARHAQRLPTAPIPVRIDNTARLRLIVQTTLLHRKETEMVEEKAATEVRVVDEG